MFRCLQGILLILLLAMVQPAFAQQPGSGQDTFFLAKKKGLWGKLGKSISTSTPPEDPPQKIENPLLKYKGKIIRSVQLIRLGFECSIYDTCDIKNNFGIRMANAFHKNSREKVIRNNLFFKEGGRFYPYLVADNERYLRDLSYIQDARIVVDFAGPDSVDVVVLTKDVFSLNAKLKIDNVKKGRIELGDENIGGSATKILFSGLYEEVRRPQNAFGTDIMFRNLGGSFIDWTTGFSNFTQSFTSGRREQTSIFTRLEKPLVTPYIPSTGSIEAAYYRTSNAYAADSLYRSQYRYEYFNVDGWIGYSLDSKRALYANKEIRVHNFVSLRGFTQHFIKTSERSKEAFDFRFTNATGVLAALNIFKQVFYKTSFIYGFGRNEDVPEGFSASLIGGYVIQQNDGYAIKTNIKKPYAGIDFNLASFKSKGFHSNYTFKAGTFFKGKRFEDMNLLFNVDHFTRLKKMNSKWFQRTFFSTGIASQVNPVFTTPLFINSEYGLPYFSPENISASDLRATMKVESVFYNTTKIIGFRLAPFIFSDFTLLKQTGAKIIKSDMYTAVGGGIRTRNENLVFGTVELKAYYFPRTNGNMNVWKIDLSTNIRFKYNSSFIKRPDFVNIN
jgi:hypothetical protein